MNIRSIRALSGPNYWSQRLPLIIMELDLEELEYKPTNLIKGFRERLEDIIPSLHEHKCSEGREGGFLYRVEEGTWMGHVIEHIAIEIQVLAGMYCPFGKTRGTGDEGIYNVIFEYKDQDAGFYTAHAAVRVAQALIDHREYDLQSDIAELKKIRENNLLGPSTQALVNEAISRGIPWRRLDDNSLIMFGYGNRQKKVSAAMTSSTSGIGIDIAGDKDLTKQMLKDARIPVPPGLAVKNEHQLDNASDHLCYPLVVKPTNGNHGRSVSIDLNSKEELHDAFSKARMYSDKVIVEKFIPGFDFRILLVNYKFIAATKRIPALVVGDGVNSIKKLVEIANNDPIRGNGHAKGLTKIEIDDYSLSILLKQNLMPDSVPQKNQIVFLKSTANLSTGGTGVDVTDSVHPTNIIMAERAARVIGLDICGLDIMAPCLTTPLTKNGGAVMEINSSPGLRMHLFPTEGKARNVAKPIIDMTFPDNQNGRIPIVAVTGTNGKTTTTRLIAHMATQAGFHTGFTTSDGIYNDGSVIEEGDCTGPDSTKVILQEPDVDFAVLECARGGILRSGLGFMNCDIGIVTNITEDHLGLNSILTIDELARVKSVIPKSVHPKGYAVLNAEDDRVFAISNVLSCQYALFGLDCTNPRIVNHCNEGGIAAYLKDGDIFIQEGEYSACIAKASDVPLTFGGHASFNIQNILASLLAGYIQNFGIERMRKGLQSFIPSSASLPGRMNLFRFSDFDVLVDYAHNPSAIQELGKFLCSINSKNKVGIITAVGDRRDQDIIDVGCATAKIFDNIIIKHDEDLRGRTQNEITELLNQGIHQIDPEKPIKIIPSEYDAVKYAITYAKPGSFITALCADVPMVLKLVEKMYNQGYSVPLVFENSLAKIG
ncbi:MAG: cyanophycin synthetase [Balneolales bacterium]